MMRDTSLIPVGPYCYTNLRQDPDDPDVIHTDLCPYWHKTESGLVICLFTGDVEIDNDEVSYREAMRRFKTEEVAEKIIGKTSLLWDQVKECGINFDDDDEGHTCHNCGDCAC